MRFSVFAAGAVASLLLLLAAASIPATAAAHQGDEIAPQVLPGGNSTEDQCIRAMTPDLTLCDKSLSNGYATVEFEADKPMSVTFADAMGWTTDGQVTTVTKTFDTGRNSIRMKVTSANGLAGVMLKTDAGQYGVQFNSGTDIVPGSPGGGDMEAAFTGGLFATVAVIAIPAWAICRFGNPVKEVF